MVQRMSVEPTGHKHGMRIVLTALVLALVIAPAAEAKSFRGETSQKRMASVVVGADGLVTRIRISYSAPCGDPRYRFPNVLRIERPFDASSDGRRDREAQAQRQAQRRRPQPSDGDRDGAPHRRR